MKVLFTLIVLFITFVSCFGQAAPNFDYKWHLWTSDKTVLRGANIDQRWNVDKEICYLLNTNPKIPAIPSVSAPAIFPAYTYEDFQGLANWKANYVNLSVPGVFAETANEQSEYLLRKDALDNLDRLIGYAEHADLFVVISFRTGPERTKEVFDNKGKLSNLFKIGKKADSNDTRRSQNAQEYWRRMWRYVADKYKGNPYIVGYDLMVEPETKDAAQWSRLAGVLVKNIREVDQTTPILIGGSQMSDISGLKSLQLETINPKGIYKHLIYTIHQYQPNIYTQQNESDNRSYNCTDKNLKYEKGSPKKEKFVAFAPYKNQTLQIYADIKHWREINNNLPVAINEFGVVRYAGAFDKPDGEQFLLEQFRELEKLGINHAIWKWDPQCCLGDDDYNFRHGQNYMNHLDTDSELGRVIRNNWNNNGQPILRPSNFIIQGENSLILTESNFSR